jgi:hypothetical protein
MRNCHQKATPVGVVPRRHAGAIQPLMSDRLETCTVAEDVDPPHSRTIPPLPQWLASVASLGIITAALEWLKLTR